MTRGNTRQSKVFYKGPTEDFVIMVEDVTAVQNWRRDHSVPLAQVLDGWKIFTSRQHGPQGIHNEASRATLEREFGTSNYNDVISRILNEGEIQENIVRNVLYPDPTMFNFLSQSLSYMSASG